jgi:hypothetical protein
MPVTAVLRLVLLLPLLTAMGCGRHHLTPGEAENATWWFEDVAHGLPRDWRELVTDDQSDGQRRLAAFARGGSVPGGQVVPPQPFRRRAARWELLRRAFADDQIRIDATGLLHLMPDVADAIAAMLRPEIAQENLDRLFGAEVLLQASGLRPDEPRADAFIALLQRAQRHHALAAGGQEWQDASTSTSANVATPSTSGPASWPTPDG